MADSIEGNGDVCCRCAWHLILTISKHSGCKNVYGLSVFANENSCLKQTDCTRSKTLTLQSVFLCILNWPQGFSVQLRTSIVFSMVWGFKLSFISSGARVWTHQSALFFIFSKFVLLPILCCFRTESVWEFPGVFVMNPDNFWLLLWLCFRLIIFYVYGDEIEWRK